MRSYRRILALVAINAGSKEVVQRAMQLARFYGATPALATVVDYTPGFECDHVPFMTPEEMRSAIIKDVRGKLENLAAESHAGGCEIIVACGDEKQVVEQLTRSWRPDLVLVGSRAPHGLSASDKSARALPYDVLIVQNGRQGFAGRLVNALASAL